MNSDSNTLSPLWPPNWRTPQPSQPERPWRTRELARTGNSHGPVTVAAAADIDFVTAAHEGDVLVATARERTRRGRSGIYDVTVLCGDEVIAEFRGRSRTLRTVGN